MSRWGRGPRGPSGGSDSGLNTGGERAESELVLCPCKPAGAGHVTLWLR